MAGITRGHMLAITALTVHTRALPLTGGGSVLRDSEWLSVTVPPQHVYEAIQVDLK